MSDAPRDRSAVRDSDAPPFPEEVTSGAVTAAIAIAIVAVGMVACAVIHRGEIQHAAKNPVLATTEARPWR